jgi:hypothetical protein
MDVAGSADAQRTRTVSQITLELSRREQIFASRLEGYRCGDQHRRDARTNDVGDPAFRGDKAEHGIRGRDHPPGKADPFRPVTVEQLVGRITGQNRRQLPGQTLRC